MLAGVRGCEVCLYISRPVGNAPADLRCFHCLQCRYVRLLHNPIAAVFSRSLMDSYSNAHAVIDECPEVEGLTFADLHFRFPGVPKRHVESPC